MMHPTYETSLHVSSTPIIFQTYLFGFILTGGSVASISPSTQDKKLRLASQDYLVSAMDVREYEEKKKVLV